MGDSFIPLLRDTKDIHYRYKMPKLTAKVEGSGNGIKTVITNMAAIAKALHRPPTYPTKYFGCELGAQVSMDRNDYIVNGAHDPEKLLQLLYQFIGKFVLCTKCKNPETDLIVVDKKINQKCTACGQLTIIPNTMHKLTTFIINHPPNEDTKSTSSKGKSSKDGKEKTTKKTKKNGTTDSSKKSDSNHDEDGFATNNGDFDDNEAFEDDFGSDDLTNYDESTVKSLVENLKGTHIDQAECGNIFYNLVKEKKEANQLGDVNVQKELVNKAEELKIRDKSTLVLTELLFTDNIVEEINTHSRLLLRFCYKNPKAQKYLLGGIEKIIGDIYKDKLLNSTVKILKLFYDDDILDEEVLFEWHEKPSKKYVSKDMSKAIREKAVPFIKWLREAEIEDDSDDGSSNNSGGDRNNSKPANNKNGTNGKQNNKSKHDDEDDDDEDDDVAIEYSHRVTGLKIEAVKPVNETKDETAEDINIDDI